MIHFTSDTHYWHANIIKYSNRPFGSVNEMNTALVDNWNSRVAPDDTVFHLGDVAFINDEDKLVQLLTRLNGKKHLIFGNHDKNLKRWPAAQACFEWCKDYHELDVHGTRVVLCHYPMMTWNKSGRGSFMLHGHCHGNLKYPYEARIMDVGVDPQSMFPISWSDVHKKLSNKTISKVDHHGSGIEM